MSSRACALEPTLSQQPSDIVRYELVPSIKMYNGGPRFNVGLTTVSDFVVLNQSRYSSLSLLFVWDCQTRGNSVQVHVKMHKLSGGCREIGNIFKSKQRHWLSRDSFAGPVA